jgi:geranylgeranyl reductase family protein
MIDVVIIGGGPAGITAGVILQKQGYRTCIIDQKKFPREKLCAGVITTKAFRLIKQIYKEIDFGDLEINYINKICLFYKKEIIGRYVVKNRYAVINRAEFDYALLKYYRKVGGLVLDGQVNYQILYNENKIKLHDGKIIRYRCLIGADGFNSRVRHYVQHKWRASILCFEKFVPNDLNEDTIKIYFGDMLGGYCWRIPCQTRVGIGLGEFYVRGIKRNVKKYAPFFEKQGVCDLNDLKGAFVSCGFYVKKPVKKNVLLVGDAAGLGDAMSGEGIFFAIESGKQAALAVIDFWENGISLSKYMIRIRRIHKKIKEQNKYNKMLYIPGFQKMCMKYMRNNPCFVKRIMDEAISSYKSGYTKEIVKNLLCSCHFL